MESKYLETVLLVADFLNFSRAAEEIPCAQSVVSRHVRSVEEELGIKIFERSQKSNVVRLTNDGARVLPMIRKIIDDVAALTETSSELTLFHKSEYTIGVFMGVIGYYAQNRFLQEMFIQFPNILVRFIPLTVPELSDFIRQRRADAFLIYEAYWNEETGVPSFSDEPGVLWETLRRQEPCIAMTSSNPLSSCCTLSLKRVQNEKFIVNYNISRYGIMPGYKMHEGFLRSCQKCGFEPTIVAMDNAACANLRNTSVLQYGYMYPTFLCACLRDDSDISYVPVENPIYYANYYFVWFRDGKAEVSREMLEYFRKQFSL